MRSKAQIQGHPIHPMLVAFPIAFLSGALVFDLVGWFTAWRTWWTTAAYLSIAGIATGLVAAVPGLIDYWLVVPPASSGKQRATYHMVVNVTSLVAFIIAWLLRGPSLAPTAGTLVLEILGIVAVTAGGWLGGTLVFRNQIGVDHRYAGAGRWRETGVEPHAGEPLTVARADELGIDQMKLVHVGDRRIVLARTEHGYVAFDDRCTHKGGSLADGVLICGTVECPWHGSQFDVCSGSVRSGPARDGIATYQVEQRGDDVQITL